MVDPYHHYPVEPHRPPDPYDPGGVDDLGEPAWNHDQLWSDPYGTDDPFVPPWIEAPEDPLAPFVDDGALEPEAIDPGWGLIDEGSGLHHFDPTADPSGVIGDPWASTEHWHEQGRVDSCAVVSQEFVIEAITGRDVSEDELVEIAETHGWYTPGGGTAPGDVGRLLEAYGIPVVREQGASMSDLAAALAGGQHVIVGLDSDEIWAPGISPLWDDALEPVPGLDANHAVEVVGIDQADPAGPMVILNDPGHPQGRGLEVPLDEFLGAWGDSGNFLVRTDG